MCAKKVPFWGEGCPYCGADKSVAQSLRMMSVVSLVGGMALGAYLSGIAGFFVGGILGCVACFVIEKLGFKVLRHNSA
jgi:hypothetical protein